jgi:hypothetical protein
MAHIVQQRTPEFQTQQVLESKVAFGRAVCYLILLVELCEAGQPQATFDPRLSRG